MLGDGAYMFANPTACHYIGQNQNLPVLTVIYNNALYGAVRRATLDMYRMASTAAEGDGRLLAELPAPAFEKIVWRMTGMASGSSTRPNCRPRCSARRRRCVAGSRRWST